MKVVLLRLNFEFEFEDEIDDEDEEVVDDEDEVHLAFEGMSAPVATYHLKRAPRC